MRTLRSQAHWMIALLVGSGMVAAAVRTRLLSGRHSRTSDSLSGHSRTVFRLPECGDQDTAMCVVTIETRQKSREVAQDAPDPFEDFFGGDPPSVSSSAARCLAECPSGREWGPGSSSTRRASS